VPAPPVSRREDIVEVLHGLEIADPYRWLEDGSSPDTKAWVAAQNERTRATLQALPARARFHARVVELLRAGSSLGVSTAGDRVFSLDREPDQDQAALVVRDDGGTGRVRTLVDPAAGGDVTTALDWYAPSRDGRLVAYGTSTSGDERSTLRVLDVDSGEHLLDLIPRTRAASVAWLEDNSAFAYTRYPDPDDVGEEEAAYHRSVYWHRLGDDPADDELVFAYEADKTAWPSVALSGDGRWMLISISLGWSRTDLVLVDRQTDERRTLIEGVDAITALDLTASGDLLGWTTLDAPRGRVIRASLEHPTADSWQTVVPEGEATIESVAPSAGSLLVVSNVRGVAHVHRYGIDGSGGEEIDLPELGSIAGFDASETTELVVLSFTSFTRPPTLMRWTPKGLEQLGRSSGLTGVTVEQVRYPSTDGTEIGMFLVRADSTAPSRDTPTLLNGYGGFSVTETPAFSPIAAAFCESGGVFAMAGIRGGGEEGETWHEAGMRERKPQVFDDFCAAADWLVDEGMTSRHRLAILGGSNGGLLVAACETRRPDLCRAVVCQVPLLDMVRFPRFLIARLWIPEYGDPDVAEELAWLHAYSPYHQVEDGTCYPATLITTGEEDSRVDPAHARKMAARLQAATSCGDDRPILLRVEAAAGHGQGKPVTKRAEEAADILAFLDWQLEIGAG
jgi:prolyl oligopeptidase